MGEAIRKESSMEDILASIRKIISSETADSETSSETSEESTDKPVENSLGRNIDKNAAQIGQSNSEKPAHLHIQKPMVYNTDPVPPLESSKSIPNPSTAANVPQKSPQKSKMSSTLDSIRAAVTGGASKAKAIDAEEKAVNQLTPKPAAPNPTIQNTEITSVSTSANPLGPSNTVNNIPKAKKETSLAELAEQLNSVTNTTNELDFTTLNTQSVETHLIEQAEIETDVSKGLASSSDEKAASASELNFKKFAQSVEKLDVPAEIPSNFIKDDVDVFVNVDDNHADMLNPTEELTELKVSTAKQNILGAPKDKIQTVDAEKSLKEKPDTQTLIEELLSDEANGEAKDVTKVDTKDEGASNIASSQVTSDKSRGSTPDKLSGNVRASVSETVAHGVARSVKDILKSGAQEINLAETDKFKDALISPTTKAAVTGSIERLKQSVVDVNTAHVENVLRPMLKEWLDNNLPNMVEKIVREEISRITQKPDNT